MNLKPSEIITKFQQGTLLAIKRLIESERKQNGYLIISENGKVIKKMAKDIEIIDPKLV